MYFILRHSLHLQTDIDPQPQRIFRLFCNCSKTSPSYPYFFIYTVDHRPPGHHRSPGYLDYNPTTRNNSIDFILEILSAMLWDELCKIS